jgi:Porin subfamily
MKMVKSLLLGSAAALVAVAGAQAADLPVKAKPVKYVKICSLYGDGFYYIPGTDTCIRFSGYVRARYGYKVNNNVVEIGSDQGTRDRQSNLHHYTMRHRARLQIDVRTQTSYGTVRAYESMNFENRQDGGSIGQNVFSLHRAFIQWAGFTFGHTKSYADVPGQLGDAGLQNLHQMWTESTTGASGVNMIAYTWQLGNGATFSVDAEDEVQVRSLYNGTVSGAPSLGGNPGNSRAGQNWPQFSARLMVHQAWGEAGIAAVAQQNRAVYYGTAAGCPAGAQLGTDQCGYPSDTWAWGVRAGAELKAPMLGPGDYFEFEGYYSEGAVRFTARNLAGNTELFGSGNEVAFGWIADAVYVDGGSMHLTTAWAADAGYRHYWTRNFSSSIFGGYTEVSYDNFVVASGLFCSATKVNPTGGQACDPGFALWQVGGRSDWYPVPKLKLAVEVMYTQVDTAMQGPINVANRVGNRPTGAYNAKDLGIVTVMFAARRTF